MLDYFCMDEIGLDFNPPLQSNWTFYHVKKLLCRHRIHSCQQNERYINTTPLIVVSCSLNVRRNSVHSTGDSSLFDQNNCPIRVLKREKKVSSQIASAYTSSLMLLLVTEKKVLLG